MRKFTIFIATLLSAILVSCGGSSEVKDAPFDYGEVKDGLYTNNYFDFTMEVPDYWTITNDKATREAQLLTSAARLGEDDRERSEVSKVRTASIFSGGVEDVDRGVYKMTIIAENLATVRIKKPEEYIEAVMLQMKDMGYPVVKGMDDKVEKVTIGGVRFYTKTIGINLVISTLNQRVLVAERDGFLLNISTVHYSDKGLEALNKVLESIVFKE